MRKQIGRAKKKLNSAWGMSLTEMLCVVLILTLVTGVMVTAVNLAARQYRESMRKSEAEILASTLETVISSELAYTRLIKTSENPIVFQSQHNKEVILTTEDPTQNNGYGQLVFRNVNVPSEMQNLLGKGAYTRGLLARVDSFTYNQAAFTFSVKLSIACDGEVYATRAFDVINVNKTNVA